MPTFNVIERRILKEFELRYKLLFLNSINYKRITSIDDWEEFCDELQIEPLGDKFDFFDGFLGSNNSHQQIRDLKGEIRSLDNKLSNKLKHRFQHIILEIKNAILNEHTNRSGNADFDIAEYDSLKNHSDDTNLRMREFTIQKNRTFICSDIHLGVNGSRWDCLTDLSEICVNGDTLIPLGDILDFWIDLADENDLKKTVIAYWKDLFRLLEQLKNKGATIILIPGNHDSFIFLIESYRYFDWSDIVFKKNPTLCQIRDALSSHRLSTIADIHYPFFQKKFDDTNILFTHGHAYEWLWRFINGNPEINGSGLSFLTDLACAVAHRYARQLRHIFNLGDTTIEWAKRLQDLALIIANDHLNDYEFHRKIQNFNGKQEFADYVEKLFEQLIYGNILTEVQKNKYIETLQKLYEWHEASDLISIRDNTEKYLNKYRNGNNYELNVNNGLINMSTTRLEEYIHFKKFVCGHFHKPRNQDPNYDNGCFFKQIATCLQINPDGEIIRPTI